MQNLIPVVADLISVPRHLAFSWQSSSEVQGSCSAGIVVVVAVALIVVVVVVIS